MNDWKIGIVGTGYWSGHHLRSWSRIPNAVVGALCDRNRERLVDRAKEFEIDQAGLYGAIEEMLEGADVDAVDIVTPPETHLDLVGQCAAAGKHILCQKPFAVTMEEAEEMVRVAEDAGVRLMVTENWRWLEPCRVIKRVLDDGELGTVHSARWRNRAYFTPLIGPGVELPQPYFKSMPRLMFYEVGSHWFDYWRFLFGNPERLSAEVVRISPHVKGEDSGVVVLRSKGFLGMIDASWATRDELRSAPHEPVRFEYVDSMVIDGDSATLKMTCTGNWRQGQVLIVDQSGNEKVILDRAVYDQAEANFRTLSHFVECLESGEEFQTSGRDNLETLKLVFGTYKSSECHRSVDL